MSKIATLIRYDPLANNVFKSYRSLVKIKLEQQNILSAYHTLSLLRYHIIDANEPVRFMQKRIDNYARTRRVLTRMKALRLDR